MSTPTTEGQCTILKINEIKLAREQKLPLLRANIIHHIQRLLKPSKMADHEHPLPPSPQNSIYEIQKRLEAAITLAELGDTDGAIKVLRLLNGRLEAVRGDIGLLRDATLRIAKTLA